MDWLRLYVEVLDDEKIAKMSDTTYRIFTYLMLMAREKDENGAVTMDIKDIAWRLRRPSAQIKKAIEHLIDLEILSNENGCLQFINWHKRQYKSDNVTERVKRYREKKETLQPTLENRTEQIQNRYRTEQNKKEKSAASQPLPDWLNKTSWDSFLEFRKKKKSPVTDQAAKLIFKKLDEYRRSGQDPGKVLEQSIMNGWTGIFELKGGNNGSGINSGKQPALGKAKSDGAEYPVDVECSE